MMKKIKNGSFAGILIMTIKKMLFWHTSDISTRPMTPYEFFEKGKDNYVFERLTKEFNKRHIDD